MLEDKSKSVFTTVIRMKGKWSGVVPVKSSKPVDKKLHIECSKALSRLYIGPPLKIGEVICKNILNTGVDIICTKNISES